MIHSEDEEVVIDRDAAYAVIISCIILAGLDQTPWFNLSLGVILAPVWVTLMVGAVLSVLGAAD